MPSRSTRSYIRICISLPLASGHAAVYANGLIAKLECEFGGSTHSRLPRSPKETSPFTGTWLKPVPRAEIAYREQVFVLTVDANLEGNAVQEDFEGKARSVKSKADLIAYLRSLKRQAEAVLQQDIVWITIHDVERVT
jgi:hypothetical protein